MDTIIARIAAMVELPPLSLPAPQEKECMVIIVAPSHLTRPVMIRMVQVCLVETRGHNRFSPCRHAVCCQDCAAMIHARGDGCIICRTNIDAVEQGEHLHLCECLVVY